MNRFTFLSTIPWERLSWRWLALPLVLLLLTGLASVRPSAAVSLQAMALEETPAAIASPASDPLPFVPPTPQHHPSVTQAHLTRSRLTHAYFLATPHG